MTKRKAVEKRNPSSTKATIMFNIGYAHGNLHVVVPLLVIYIFAQKHIIKGLTAGAVKG